MEIIGARIQGFRSVADVEFPLRRCSLFLGPNGAGKSNILEALGLETREEGSGERRDEALPDRVSLYLRVDKQHPTFAAEVRRVVSEAFGEESIQPEIDQAVATLMSASVIAIRTDRGARIDGRKLTVHLCVRTSSKMQTAPSWLKDWIVAAQMRDLVSGVSRPALVELMPIDLGHPNVDVVTVFSDPDDVSESLLRWSQRALNSVPTSGSASMPIELAASLDSGALRPILGEIERRANDLLPAFLKDVGSIEITVTPGPDGWLGQIAAITRDARLHDNPERVAIALERIEQIVQGKDTVDFHLDAVFRERALDAVIPFWRLGNGQRRWIVACLEHAARDVIRISSGTVRPDPHAPSASLIAIDEPTQNLHPRAQGDVLTWIDQQTLNGANAMFSSHSPALLRSLRSRSDVSLIGVHRDLQGTTHVLPIRDSVLQKLEQFATALGISTPDVLLLARAILLVEGVDDLAVVRGIYGEQLEKRSVLIHHVGGSDHRTLLELVQGDVFRRIGIPIFVMLDKTNDPKVQGAWDVRQSESPEMRALQQLRRLLAKREGAGVSTIPFEPDDIVCGIAADTIERAFPQRKGRKPFQSWPQELADWRAWRQRTKRPSKEWFRERFQLIGNEDAFDLLRASVSQPGAKPSRWLKSSMTTLFEHLDRPSRENP